MNKVTRLLLFSLAIIAFISACNCPDKTKEAINKTEEVAIDHLPSWNDTPSKQNIISFVQDVTNENSPNFIKAEDRIATFDNDGTLWSEQPYYFQLAFALDQLKKMATEHPEWMEDELFAAAINGDIKTVLSYGEKGLLKIVMVTHSGMSSEEFEQQVSEWINSATHPKTGKLYKEMVYKPMLEVLDYLRANNFKLFIVSGGGIDFMRAWAEEVYGIPNDQIVGTVLKTEFVNDNNDVKIMRLPEIDFIDDKEGKPVGINKFIGKKPIISFGNSDGDLQMQEYTDNNKLPNLVVYIHHTDGEREWAYDRESHIGKFDKGLDKATEKGWTVVDMKKDWKWIYPFE